MEFRILLAQKRRRRENEEGKVFSTYVTSNLIVKEWASSWESCCILTKMKMCWGRLRWYLWAFSFFQKIFLGHKPNRIWNVSCLASVDRIVAETIWNIDIASISPNYAIEDWGFWQKVHMLQPQSCSVSDTFSQKNWLAFSLFLEHNNTWKIGPV